MWPGDRRVAPGIHETTWAEVVERFGFSARRQMLLSGLQQALRSLAHAGCKRVYLGGSFVTTRNDPGDWDGCYYDHQ
ncbi:MAG TPA: hypothetical protein VHB98_10450 [Chloroflexota bacterium]|jgi:hypothetical protein|nr:hypothetical protein [Chloroflexota bacterium]